MAEIWRVLVRTMSPQQVCWICLLATVGAGSYGMKTFASNSDLSGLNADVRGIKVVMLEDRAFNLRAQQCRSMAAKQPSSAYLEQLQDVLRKYRDITGAEYRLPGCEEL
jgi:hypothetical protein